MTTRAVYAGSFDPFTYGHLDILHRALDIFDNVIVAVGINPRKTGLWSVEDRVRLIKAQVYDLPEVTVESYSGLTAEFARRHGAGALVRGVRCCADFEAERNLADINRDLNGMETVILAARPEFSFVSSSMVRELIANGADASKYFASLLWMDGFKS